MKHEHQEELQQDKLFPITESLDRLLRGSDAMPIGLCHLHLASAEQLCRLHYAKGSLKAVKAKLRLLADHGYVQIDELPTKRLRSPYHYLLDTKGIAYLKSLGMDVSSSFRSEKEIHTSFLFVQHTLEVNDIIISAALLKKVSQTHWLESFLHERELKTRPYTAIWQGGKFSLIPDAFLVFLMVMPDGRKRRMAIVLEHDRGTEEQYYFRRRIRAYLILLKKEGYRQMFDVGSITIAFTTSAGVERLKKMREWTLQELEATGESSNLGNAFYFTPLEWPIDPRQLWLEPCWGTLYSHQPQPLLAI